MPTTIRNSEFDESVDVTDICIDEEMHEPDEAKPGLCPDMNEVLEQVERLRACPGLLEALTAIEDLPVDDSVELMCALLKIPGSTSLMSQAISLFTVFARLGLLEFY